MFCTQCHNDLSECTCTDLKERLEKLAKSPHLIIGKKQKTVYDKQAKRNDEEKTVQE
jgi:hypothetical protein